MKKKKKKHIDTFLLSKDKHYKYYFKSSFPYKSTKNPYLTNCNSELNYEFGLQVIKGGYLRLDSIKAVLKLIKWFLRRYDLVSVKYKINFFPDFTLTARSKETRMGKGKADISEKVALVKKNTILIEFKRPNTEKQVETLKKLLKNCKIKLNLKTKIIKNFW